jgi:DNA-binding MarR family transcriptional regulator
MTMTELAQKINRDKSTTTVLVRKLCRSGFVTRKQSPTDKRIVFISLSPTGREYTKSTAMISKQLNNTCYTGFSDKEKEDVYNLLTKIADNFSNAL